MTLPTAIVLSLVQGAPAWACDVDRPSYTARADRGPYTVQVDVADAPIEALNFWDVTYRLMHGDTLVSESTHPYEGWSFVAHVDPKGAGFLDLEAAAHRSEHFNNPALRWRDRSGAEVWTLTLEDLDLPMGDTFWPCWADVHWANDLVVLGRWRLVLSSGIDEELVRVVDLRTGEVLPVTPRDRRRLTDDETAEDSLLATAMRGG